jgi:LysR family nitrogen assimilation transcriptional regulator
MLAFADTGEAMDLRQMRYFVALYEEKNVTKAARKVNVVQAAVSQQIRRLEASYGVELFDRTQTGLIPNSVAQRLYPVCLRTLEEAERAVSLLRTAKGKIAGRVAFGVLPSIPQGTLGRLLVEFHDSHPDAQVSVRDGYSHQLLNGVLDGLLDFAVVASPEQHAQLRFEQIGDEELTVVGSVETLAGLDEVRGEELSRFKLVLSSSRNFQRNAIDRELASAGLQLRPELEVESLANVYEIVTTPMWASIVSPCAFPHEQFAGRLKCVRLVQPTLSRRLMLAFLSHKEPSVAARLLMNVVRETFAAIPGMKAAV